jgi:DNA-binding MarR family transcriptional regulator
MVDAQHPRPVAWLARDVGANRLTVRHVVHELERDGHLWLQPYPHHRRAHLVVLAEREQQAYHDALRLQAP